MELPPTNADEDKLAADAAPPAAATALDWDAADATEGGTVSILLYYPGSRDKTCGGVTCRR